MSIPYNDNLKWAIYNTNPDWHKSLEQEQEILNDQKNSTSAVSELFTQTFKQSYERGFQFIRDLARLGLKVPIRAIKTPIVFPKNWKERERCKINAKLTGYSCVHLLSVPVKFLVAIAAILTSAVSHKGGQWLLDKSARWTIYLDGRASQLEALKEEGIKNANSPEMFNQYKNWLYEINAKNCRKLVQE